VKSNNENKIVTTRLVKEKDGERRTEKALKNPRDAPACIKKKEGEKS